MTDDRLKPGHCHKCGLSMSDNPHPEAGKPPHYLSVGCPRECIPCLALSRHQWATRAMNAEIELRDLKEARATPADQEPASQEKFEWARKVYDVSESVPGELQRFWDCAVKSAGVKND